MSALRLPEDLAPLPGFLPRLPLAVAPPAPAAAAAAAAGRVTEDDPTLKEAARGGSSRDSKGRAGDTDAEAVAAVVVVASGSVARSCNVDVAEF